MEKNIFPEHSSPEYLFLAQISCGMSHEKYDYCMTNIVNQVRINMAFAKKISLFIPNLYCKKRFFRYD